MKNLFIQAFIGLATHPEALTDIMKILDSELSMPNIPLPVVDGGVFWQTLGECNGWKLQQNTVTKSARILNSDNVRIAWGTINGMEKALDRMIEYLQKYN